MNTPKIDFGHKVKFLREYWVDLSIVTLLVALGFGMISSAIHDFREFSVEIVYLFIFAIIVFAALAFPPIIGAAIWSGWERWKGRKG